MLHVHADWLVKLQISCAIYLRATREKWHPGLHPWQVKKSSKLIFCGVYYLTVLVYTKNSCLFISGVFFYFWSDIFTFINPKMYTFDLLIVKGDTLRLLIVKCVTYD